MGIRDEIESVLLEARAKSFAPQVLMSQSSHLSTMQTIEATVVMPHKTSDYVFSPEPLNESRNDDRPLVKYPPKPGMSKSVVERCASSYFALLATVHYRTELVAQTDIRDEEDGDGDEVGRNQNVRQELRTSYTVVPNGWFWNKGFTMSYSKMGQGWLSGLHLRAFNVRSEDALIFEFCSRGNVDGVRSLLDRKEASPFDTDRDGWTPLHVRI